MITLLQKTDPINIAAAGTQKFNKLFDLGSVQNLGDVSSIEIKTTNNATPPGAANLTVKAAFCTDETATPTELSTAAIELVCPLVNTASLRRFYLMPLLYQGARYLRVWADLDALAGGAQVDVVVSVNAKRG